MEVPLKLIELWLTMVHGALCRQVAGGLLAQLPIGTKLLESPKDEDVYKLAVFSSHSDHNELEQEAHRAFGSSWLFAIVADDLQQKVSKVTPHLSLRRVLSELQNHLVENDALPPEAEALAFLLRRGEYRSRHIPVARVNYHIVPHAAGWQLNRQGRDDGETYANKEQAVLAGAARARAHAAGQLIIHNADGTFEEGRTYGDAPN